MSPLLFAYLFAFFLLLTLSLKLWLAQRQMRCVQAHRNAVPQQFSSKISLAAHQKAADYTVAKTRFGLISTAISALLLVCLTFLGGLQAIATLLLPHLGAGMVYQLALIVTVAVIAGLVDLPLDYFRQFSLEAHFGFNKMSPKLFFADLFKNTVIGALIGLPLTWLVLWLMQAAGSLWWFYAWIVFCAFQLLMLVLYPSVIAPLFNKFTPLADEDLKTRIEALMARVGFASQGLFVMDGSKRSAHGNAYFSGFGAAKRIVFFDTLLEKLAPAEVEAVLAHELGHFKLKHIVKRIVLVFGISLAFLALLGYLKNQLWFYLGLGVMPVLGGSNDAMALILFMLALPAFTFIFSPLMAIGSRKHEFEADAFAAQHSSAAELVAALVKLYEDNASTLTPDPLHSLFYDSHPNASLRIARLGGTRKPIQGDLR